MYTAEAVYCQLGDISRDLVRPSKLDESKNPSGKLVGELAAKGETATLKIVKVGEFAMRGDVCGSRAAYVRWWLASPHDARYHRWWYANSIALGVGLKG